MPAFSVRSDTAALRQDVNNLSVLAGPILCSAYWQPQPRTCIVQLGVRSNCISRNWAGSRTEYEDVTNRAVMRSTWRWNDIAEHMHIIHLHTRNLFTNFTFMWPCIVTNFLIVIPTRWTNFSNLFWKWNSTCFGQFLCPSSGVIYCTLNDGICRTGL
jgi:hypothetical protein